ncbi:MAG: hypothetical protein AVDCRST_MAG93-7778, partial [uncultured Chloroflexia bacterium]
PVRPLLPCRQRRPAWRAARLRHRPVCGEGDRRAARGDDLGRERRGAGVDVHGCASVAGRGL